jgi:hypothetical protein
MDDLWERFSSREREAEPDDGGLAGSTFHSKTPPDALQATAHVFQSVCTILRRSGRVESAAVVLNADVDHRRSHGQTDPGFGSPGMAGYVVERLFHGEE